VKWGVVLHRAGRSWDMSRDDGVPVLSVGGIDGDLQEGRRASETARSGAILEA